MKIASLNAEEQTLVQTAIQARLSAYSPYSRFAVGAALLGENGQIFQGANVENLSFGLTMCAERVAVGSAIAAGVKQFKAIAIVADTDQPLSPCGACRQVLAEFNEGLLILSFNLKGDLERLNLSELLPRAKTGILDQP